MKKKALTINQIQPWSLVALPALMLCGVPASADQWEDRLKWSSADDRFSVRLGGRLHADIGAIDYSRPSETSVESELRRARLNMSGRLFGELRYRFEYDFAATSGNEIKDAWIGYYGGDRWRLRVGNVHAPLGLEALSSSNATTFMERALPNALLSSYSLGILGETWGRIGGQPWGASAGLFDGPIQNSANDLRNGWGFAARAFYAPSNSAGDQLHLGISSEYREPSGARRVRFSARPEIHLSDRRLVSTGTLSDVDYVLTTGLEVAGIRGPFSLQGEYVRNEVARSSSRPDVSFHGWYAQAAWMLIGGQRDYNRRTGDFLAVQPRGKGGAWELALRRSAIDLEDGPITGGHERNWTFGLNWYANRNTRVMLNYVHADGNPASDGRDAKIESIQARLQFSF
ncbi:MAG: OprO/OprP family phosphate-selective porin [Thiohalocapsa sp.]|jgi:phosphate-selective porin OprO/OprP|nr:OprO/OprP family phosphate-selective porin [Thiohalocapsa sp.]